MAQDDFERNYFLKDIPLQVAQDRYKNHLNKIRFGDPGSTETIPINDSVGRVSSQSVFAKISSPNVTTSAMDGIAIKYESSIGATETRPIKLLEGSDFMWVDTGDPIPEGFDSVIMIEDLERLTNNELVIRSPVAPYQHIRKIAEDIAAPELLIQKGTVIRSLDLACLGASGLSEVEVTSRPKICFIPTGTELVKIGETPGPGQIIEFNSVLLSALVAEWGGEAVVTNPVPDDPVLLEKALLEAGKNCDVSVVIAGSSAGSEDFTSAVISKVGEVIVHGVAIRPGHPVILGSVSGKPVMGMPGYPSSALVTAELFLKPMVLGFLSSNQIIPDTLESVIGKKVSSPLGEEEFLRVIVASVDGTYVANPTTRGAAMTLSIAKSDGVVSIPASSEGMEEGAKALVFLNRNRSEVTNTLLISGSHDIALDILASELTSLQNGIRLISSSVGSVGGLLSLSKGFAHMAGTHLLDEVTGDYNVSAVKRHITNQKIHIYDFVGRTQGIMVQKGNPKGIKDVKDLLGSGTKFLNRQRGSGTRVLFDFLLKQAGIDSENIVGYDNEEYTHWNVAAAVSSGFVDAGMGIMAAALASDLEFIPLENERYQIAIPSKFIGSLDNVDILLETLLSKNLRKQIDSLGGYDVSMMGNIAAIVG
ncbi:molybdopterin biosynthesis protein [Chloroflexi bacterium]|nr:molybdopterin biosynthesis protein [Chloroflexota bacterium]